jgi:hypothetical protein
MSDQKQHVGTQSLAIQSGGNTTITQGLSPENMRQILEVLASQLSTYTAIAREFVDGRLADFEQRVIARFSDLEKANPEAFKDPDFQYVITRAQHAYARSGDEGVRDTLVDLIAARSQQTNRSRLSLTLNDAIEKAAVLTKNEFAELTLCFLMRYSLFSFSSLAAFGAQFSRFVSPLLPDISTSEASYQYIEAQSCGTIGLGEAKLVQILRLNYAGIFSGGFERTYLVGFFTEDRIKQMEVNQLVIPCLKDPAKLQLNAPNRQWFDGTEEVRKLPKNEQDILWNVFDSSVWNGETLLQNVERVYPEIRVLNSLWDDTLLKNLSLTTIGIAIGHVNCARIAGSGSNLDTWIR